MITHADKYLSSKTGVGCCGLSIYHANVVILGTNLQLFHIPSGPKFLHAIVLYDSRLCLPSIKWCFSQGIGYVYLIFLLLPFLLSL